MPYNYEEDYFNCCKNEKLEYQKTSVRWSEKDEDYKIEREYYNKEACSHCPDKDKCCSGKYRKVSITGGILALNMEKKMRNYENVLKYMKRFSTVEPPIGVFKRFYHVDEFLSNSMVGIQNRINICSGSYNLKRLYNQLMAIEGIDEDNILDFTRNVCKLTNVEMFNSRDNDILFIENKLLLPYYCESIKQKELEYYAEINANSSQLKLTDYAA